MRILLTGQEGYIGTVMAPSLVATGHELMGVDTDIFADCAFGETPLEIPKIHKDIRRLEIEDLDRFDAVIDLATISNDPIWESEPNPDLRN